MKVIFLDFDGVLNSLRTMVGFKGKPSWPLTERHELSSYHPNLDPVAVGLLKRTVEETGAKIVVSSTWRLSSSLRNFHTIFDYYDWNTAEIVIGVTGQVKFDDPSEYSRHGRGTECLQWIELWNKTKNDKIEDYVCIDDDRDFTDEQKANGNFIHVKADYGLSVEHYRAIVAKFCPEKVEPKVTESGIILEVGVPCRGLADD